MLGNGKRFKVKLVSQPAAKPPMQLRKDRAANRETLCLSGTELATSSIQAGVPIPSKILDTR